jgi:hypothetical protein
LAPGRSNASARLIDMLNFTLPASPVFLQEFYTGTMPANA